VAKNSDWGHTKINLEIKSRSERRKKLEELVKQEDKFNKLVDKLKQNARRETDQGDKDND
jgi:hypothetical protein